MEAHSELLVRLYAQASGPGAEFYGDAHLGSDRWVRTTGIPKKARMWASQQTPEFGALIRALAAGLNAWATEHPGLLSDAARRVVPLTPEDEYAHGLRIIHYDWLTRDQTVYSKAPGFALMAVVTLASGLGATATVFSAVDALFIRPLAVETPYGIFVLRGVGEPRTRFPLEFHQSLNESRTVFTESVASFRFPVTLIASGTGTRARAAFVTPNYFGMLGVRPTLGRLFHTNETRDVVVISHRLWKQRFGCRTSVVGEVVQIGAATFVIGGVSPPSFGGLQLDIALDVWVPMSASPTAVPIPSFRPSVDIVGRLAGGPSPEALPGLIGGWLVRSLESPVSRLFKMKAPRKIRPRLLPPSRLSGGAVLGVLPPCICSSLNACV